MTKTQQTLWLVLVALVLAGCDPDATQTANNDAATVADTQAADTQTSDAPDAPDTSTLSDLPPDPDIADFTRLCDLAVEARKQGKMGDAKLLWVAEQFDKGSKRPTSQVKSLLKTMQSVPAANRCLLLQTGARKAGLEQDQLCTALCPMIRHEEAALKDVKLPVSSSDVWASKTVAWTLVASASVVRVGKLAVVPIFEGEIDPAFKDGNVVRSLGAVMDLSPTPEGEVASLVVDASAKTTLLMDLMATLEQRGAKRFELMLQGGGKLDEAAPTVEANQLTDDAVQLLRWRQDPPPEGPRVQVWADEFGILITTWGADGQPQRTLQPKCQRSVCALEAEHPLAQVNWIGVYNAMLAAKQLVGAGVTSMEVAASPAISVEILTKISDVARYPLASTPNATAGETIPDNSDALRTWHTVKDSQGNPLPMFNEVVLTTSAGVDLPGTPEVSGLTIKGLSASAQTAIGAEAFHLRSCFVKHGKGLTSPGLPYMVMVTLTLNTADGSVVDQRFMEMSTASGTVPSDLQTCWTDRLRRQRYTGSEDTLRFLMTLD